MHNLLLPTIIAVANGHLTVSILPIRELLIASAFDKH